jgi:non-homologous end joining protein Ku
VLREAIANTGKTALASVEISQRKRTIGVRPTGDALMAHTLDEERDLNGAKDLFEGLAGIKVAPEDGAIGKPARAASVRQPTPPIWRTDTNLGRAP